MTPRRCRSALSAPLLSLLLVIPAVAGAQAPAFITKWSVGASGGLSIPCAVATSLDGSVYVADTWNHQVQKFNYSGGFESPWGSGEGLYYAMGVAVDGSGSVFVALYGNQLIKKFTSAGSLVTQFGSGGSGNGQFSDIGGVAVDAAGFVYVVDLVGNRIEKFTNTGTFVLAWGTPGIGNGQFSFAWPSSGVAIDGAGNVYVTDTGNNRIQKFTDTGAYVGQWGATGSGTGQFNAPHGVAVDGDGHVYVVEEGNHRVQVFTANGAYVTGWGGLGGGDGQFRGPRGIAVDHNGLIFVADTGNNRIQEFDSIWPHVPPLTVSAVSPSGTVSPATPSLTVPVTLTRTDATPLLGYSVRFHLTNLTLSGPGTSGVSQGGFLTTNNPATSFQVLNNGGGSYTVDNVTLGTPCGSSALTGTLFNVTVGSSALTGPGLVTLDEVTVFDCSNAPTTVPIGAAASIAIDYALPVVTVTAPNGGELSPITITWTATDNVAVTSVDLALSTDGGVTFPNTIATGIPNTGSYAWAPPPVVATQARVRVTALDVNGNVANDTSDADFTIGRFLLTVNVSNGTVVKVPDQPSYEHGTEVTLTATPAPGYHFVDWAGDVTGTANPVNLAMDGHKTVTANIVINPPVAPITALAVSPASVGDDADGTTKIQVTWPAVLAGEVVQVYRAGFGGYPQYDGLGGAVPVVPTYPPSAPWGLTGLAASGTSDEPPARDFYYYVAFVTDPYGTVSPASNIAGGVLNYHLGDIADGFTLGQGDNQVGVADVSLLGFHYSATGASLVGFEYLDVGPTTDRTVHGRPTTDGKINIEDLLIFGLNYGVVSAPALVAGGAAASGPDELELRLTDESPGSMMAHLELRGSGAIQALSAVLGWNPDVVAPTGFTSGQLLVDQRGVAMSPRPGSVDATLLGARAQGMSGVGEVATITFRRLKPGDEGIVIRSAMARSASNSDVPLATRRLVPGVPTTTALAAVLPNPFQSTATLSFSLSRPGPVDLEIYSVDGRRVRTLAHGARDAGEYRVEWDGRNDSGQPVNAGIYYARLSTVLGRLRRTLVRLK